VLYLRACQVASHASKGVCGDLECVWYCNSCCGYDWKKMILIKIFFLWFVYIFYVFG